MKALKVSSHSGKVSKGRIFRLERGKKSSSLPIYRETEKVKASYSRTGKTKAALKKEKDSLSVRETTKLRRAVLNFLHDRKDHIVIVECKSSYIIIAKRVKLITTEIANASGFQPVERVTESFKVILSILTFGKNPFEDGGVDLLLTSSYRPLRERIVLKNFTGIGNMRNLLVRQLIMIGCPIVSIQREEEILEKLGE